MPSEERPEKERREPRPGEVTSRWRAVEWTEAQRIRLATLLIGLMPNDPIMQGS